MTSLTEARIQLISNYMTRLGAGLFVVGLLLLSLNLQFTYSTYIIPLCLFSGYLALALKLMSPHYPVSRRRGTVAILKSFFLGLTATTVVVNLVFPVYDIILSNTKHQILLIATIAVGVMYFLFSSKNGEQIDQRSLYTQKMSRFIKMKVLAPRLSPRVIVLISLTILSLGYAVLAERMIYTVDEGYTYNSVQAIEKYKETGLSISGASYERASFYTYMVYLASPYIPNEKLSLRFISILFALATIIVLYKTAVRIFDSWKYALAVSCLIATNWFFVSIALTARNYIFSLFLVSMSIYIVIRLIQESKHGYYKLFLFCLLFALITINYFEGFVIFSFHTLLLLGVLIMFDADNRKLLFPLTIAAPVLGLLAYTIFPSSIAFVFNTLQIDLSRVYWEALYFLGSIFSIENTIGILALSIIAMYSLTLYRENRVIFILSVFTLTTLIIQIFLFTERRSYPRYLADLLIPIAFILAYVVKTRFARNTYIFCGFILLIVSTSAVNLTKIYQQELGYSNYQPNSYEKALEYIPYDAVIITDMPNTVRLLRHEQPIYALRDNPNDPELVYENGEYYYEGSNPREPVLSTPLQQKRFALYKPPNQVLASNQLYIYYDKAPKIMSIEHLNDIYAQNNEVYLILTHNAFENKNMRGNYELRRYISEHAITLSHEAQTKYAFDLRQFDTSVANPLLLYVGKLELAKNN